MSERVVVLVRHAKSEQDAPSDVERELAPRGRRDAAAGGRWLAGLGVVPDLVVVSPAVRARQTWDELAPSLPVGDHRTDGRIYDNTAEDLLEVLSDVADDVMTVMLVGHSPSMHALAAALDDGTGDGQAREALREGYPTCGIAVFDLCVAWSQIGPGDGRLRAFDAPRG